MEYSKIIAVTGLPGLYELVNSKNDGAIIRSLDDKSTRFASSRIHNFSHLESIEIYTTGENVNLVDIFHAMEKTGGSLPDAKENDSVKKYFEKVYPELDFERVYTSDLKKMVKWFDVLKKNDIEIKLSELPEEEEPVEEEVKEEVVVVAGTAKKPAAKKAAAPAKSKEEKPVKEEEPKKKAPAKAKKEEPAKADTKKAAPKKAAEKPKAEKPKAAAKPKKEDDKTAKKKK